MAGRSLGTAYVEIDLDPSRYIRSQQRLYKDATSTSLKIEDNFKKLGIKSSAEFDLMRAKITNSYNAIKNSAQATANDIVRAERAKNEQLKRLNEQQYGHQKSLLDNLKEHWKIYATAAVASLYVIQRASRTIISLSMEQEKAEIALGAALRANNEYTQERIKGYKDFASAIQAVTKYGDEEILKLMALQKNLGVTSDKLEEATKMSIGLATATGRDINSMAMYIALAQQGEFTMLRRYIPALRATTDKTEQLKIVTEFAARGFEVAKEEAETFSGSVTQLTNLLGDFLERIGNVIVRNERIKELMEEGKRWLLTAVREIEEGGNLAVWANKMGIAIVKAMQTGAEAVHWLYEAFKALQWAVSEILAELLEKTAMVYDWLSKIPGRFSEAYAITANSLRQKAQIWHEVSANTANDFNKINNAFDAMIERLENITTGFKGIGGVANEELEQIEEKAKTALKELEEFVSSGVGATIEEEFEKAEGWYDRRRKRIEKETEDRLKEEKKKNEKILKEHEHMLERMHDSTSDFIYDLMDGQLNSWRKLFDRVFDWFKRLLADMITQAILKPIVVPIVASFSSGMVGIFGSFGGGGGDIFSTLSGASNLAGAGGFDMAGALGISGLMSTPIWGAGGLLPFGAGAGLPATAGLPAYGGFTGASPAPMLGPTMAAGALGYLGYSTIGDWIGLPQGGYSGLGSAAGGAGGYMLGQTIGWLGGPLGAVIGTIIGGVLGSFLGPGEPTMDLSHMAEGFGASWMPGQGLALSTQAGTYGGSQGQAITQISDAYREGRNAIVTAFNEQVTGLMTTLGGEYSGIIEDMLMSEDFAYIDDFTFYIHDAEEELTRQLGDFAGFLDDKLREIMDAVIPKYVSGEIMGTAYYGALTSGAQQNLQSLLGGGLTAEQSLSLLQSFSTNATAYEDLIFQMEQMAGVLSDIEIQEYNVNKQFDTMIANLQALGVAEEEITRAEGLRALALANLTDTAIRDTNRLQQQYIDLVTGGTNQADIFERLAIMESMLPKPGTALTEADLDLYMKYLALAEEAYTRPSSEYGAIYDIVKAAFESVMGEIPSYQSGILSVPVTGPAIVHQGEKITPAGENAGGDMYVYSPTYHIDGSQNPEQIMRLIDRQNNEWWNSRGRRMAQMESTGGIRKWGN